MDDLGGHPPLRRGPANTTAFAWLTKRQRQDVLGRALLGAFFFHLAGPHGCQLCAGQDCRSLGAFLVVQWLRIYLSTQWTQVQSLVWEDPTWAAKPVPHSSRARDLQLLKPTNLESVLRKRSHCNEKPEHWN